MLVVSHGSHCIYTMFFIIIILLDSRCSHPSKSQSLDINSARVFVIVLMIHSKVTPIIKMTTFMITVLCYIQHLVLVTHPHH